MTWLIRIPEGGRIPQGYGVAWLESWGCWAVCLPLGLNVLVGWGREAVIWMKCRAYPHLWADQLDRARREGT